MENKGRKIIRSLTMISQIGICMMVPIFLSAWIGVWLNHILNTEIAFLILLFLGIGAAFRNVYILTKSFYAADMKKEHEHLEYIQSLKNYRAEHPEEYETGEADIEGNDIRHTALDSSSGSDSDDYQ